MSDQITLMLDRGEARGIVEILEAAVRTHRYPMRVLDVARRLELLLGEPRPYPELPPRVTRYKVRDHVAEGLLRAYELGTR